MKRYLLFYSRRKMAKKCQLIADEVVFDSN